MPFVELLMVAETTLQVAAESASVNEQNQISSAKSPFGAVAIPISAGQNRKYAAGIPFCSEESRKIAGQNRKLARESRIVAEEIRKSSVEIVIVAGENGISPAVCQTIRENRQQFAHFVENGISEKPAGAAHDCYIPTGLQPTRAGKYLHQSNGTIR